MKRRYTMSEAAVAARAAAARKPRPKARTETKWHQVRIPADMYHAHKKENEAWHITVARKLKRPAGTTLPAKEQNLKGFVPGTTPTKKKNTRSGNGKEDQKC